MIGWEAKTNIDSGGDGVGEPSFCPCCKVS